MDIPVAQGAESHALSDAVLELDLLKELVILLKLGIQAGDELFILSVVIKASRDLVPEGG